MKASSLQNSATLPPRLTRIIIWFSLILIAAIVLAIPLLNGSVQAGDPAVSAALSSTDYLYSVADATIKSAQPTVNFGTATTLDVRYGGDAEPVRERAVLLFNLDYIPSEAIIDQATLRLTLLSATGSNDKPVTVKACNLQDSWRELTVTWNNQPTVPQFALCASSSVGLTLQNYTWDLTSIARAWHAGTNNGLMLGVTESGTIASWRSFGSLDGKTYAPMLEVTYSLPTPTFTASYTATNTLTPSPTSTPTRTPSPTATTSLSGQYDSWVDQDNPTANHGSSSTLKVAARMGTSDLIHSNALLWFQVDALPVNQYVSSAQLDLYQFAAIKQQNNTIDIQVLGAAFDEMLVTWGNQPSYVNADIPAADVSPAAGWKAWDLTDQVRKWALNPPGNYGLAVINSSPDERSFSAREGSNPPRLTINIGSDSQAPNRPANIWSLTHTGGEWSNRANVIMAWDAATDNGGAGIRGYSTSFNHDWDAPAPEVFSTAATQTVLDLNSDGVWFFHIKAVDWAGHWSADKFWGAIYIDTQAPANPVISSSTHSVGVWSTNPNVSLSWSGASDGSGSGVAGYSYEWDFSSTTIPDTTVDTTGTTLSSNHAEGASYFHLRTVDNVGNWSATVHFGPIQVDTTPPTNPVILSSTHIVGVWSTNSTVSLTWEGAADIRGSGVAGFSIFWDDNPSTVPSATLNTTTPYGLSTRYDGTSYFHLRSKDYAGNWSTAVHFGPILIDTSPPTNPVPTSISHQANGWSNNTTIVMNWTQSSDIGSGLGDYQYAMNMSAEVPNSWWASTPDTAVALTVGEGQWYFHVRSRDQLNHWTSDQVAGPYKIDIQPPPWVGPVIVKPGVQKSPYKAVTEISWLAGLDYGPSGLAFYTVRASQQEITEANWDSAETVAIVPGFDPAPSALADRPFGVLWYYAVRAMDLAGNLSPINTLLSEGNLKSNDFRPEPNGYQFVNHGWDYAPYLDFWNFRQVCDPDDDVIDLMKAARWYSYWADKKNTGLCNGMTVSAEWFMQSYPVPVSHFKAYADHPWELEESSLALMRHIVWTHILQSWEPTASARQGKLGSGVIYTLSDLTSRLFGGYIGRPILSMVGPEGEGGHAVAPYALQFLLGDKIRVFIYDPNFPGDMNRSLILDPKGNAWQYEQDTTYGTGGAFPQLLSLGNDLQAAPPECQSFNMRTEAASATADTQVAQLFGLGAGRLLIMDAQGHRLGFAGDQLLREIPGAWYDIPTGSNDPLEDPIYFLPLTQQYSIMLDGSSTRSMGQASVGQVSPDRGALVENIMVDATTRDWVTIAADGTAVSYQPGTVARRLQPSIQHPALTLGLKSQEWEYRFKASGLAVGSGQSVALRVDVPGNRLVLDGSRAATGAYNLEVVRQVHGRQKPFMHSQVPFTAGDTHYMMVGDWDGEGPITLQIDHGSDGTVDETLSLTNQLSKIYLPMTLH